MSSSAVEAKFKFWALTVPKDSTKELKMVHNDYIYHVSNVTLGQGVSKGRTTVFLKANEEEAAICNLVPNSMENASIDLIVCHNMNPSFIVRGPNAVTISGYVQPLSEDGENDILPAVENTTSISLVPEENKSETAQHVQKLAEDEPFCSEDENDFKKRKFSKVEPAAVKARPPKKKRINNDRTLRKKKTAGLPREEAEWMRNMKYIEKMQASGSYGQRAKNKKRGTKEKEKVNETVQSLSKKSKKSMVDAGKGVKYRVLKKGKTEKNPAKWGETIKIQFIGQLKDGTQFDKNLREGLTFTFGGNEVVSGIELGALGMCPGEKRRIIIPPEQGYGKEGGCMGKIPPNSELHFTVKRKERK